MNIFSTYMYLLRNNKLCINCLMLLVLFTFLQLFGCRLNNVFGRAEQVRADLSFGTRTRMSYQVSN